MIDFSKPVQTRDGRSVRIYATDGRGQFSVHGAVRTNYGRWVAKQWRFDGSCFQTVTSSADLVQSPPPKQKRVNYVNVYRQWIAGDHETRSAADYAAGDNRIACVRTEVEFHEGQFDE